MRIISPGIPPQAKLYTVTCRNCGCRFEFTHSDARYAVDPRDGDALVVRCPQQGCNKEEWVTP